MSGLCRAVDRCSVAPRTDFKDRHAQAIQMVDEASLAAGTSSGRPFTIGLLSIQANSETVAASWSLTVIWVSLLQCLSGFLIFDRMYRCCRQQQQQSEDDLKLHRVALSRTQDAVIVGLTHLAESRDGDTEGHLDRVGRFAACLAEAAAEHPEFADEITEEFVRLIQVSSALHDIGKVGIEDSILQKPGRLTEDERRRMQNHTRISSQCLVRVEACLGDANFLQLAHQIALFHHEWWDGTGYPTGLSGTQIPLAARIVAIADVYDALSARRVYKDAYPHEDCVALIVDGSGTQFDPQLVDVFLEVQSRFAGIISACDDEAQAIPFQRAAALTSRKVLDSLLVEVEEAVVSVSC
jgi:HD-GYP domain-containing protein (c-di-GMP phosphodiesterase class II)